MAKSRKTTGSSKEAANPAPAGAKGGSKKAVTPAESTQDRTLKSSVDVSEKSAAKLKKGAKNSPAGKNRKHDASPATPAVPVIDTSHAANLAARFVANRERLAKAQQTGEESGSFKQLKEGLHKPAGLGAGDVLGKALPHQQRSNLPHGFGKQTGHNQTTHSFNKTGVPRRNPG